MKEWIKSFLQNFVKNLKNIIFALIIAIIVWFAISMQIFPDVTTHVSDIPVEVKAEVNLRAKSLKTYQEKFSPDISVRTSMADFKKEDWLINLPLYAIERIDITVDELS